MAKNSGAKKFVLGAVLGAGIALLFAPKSGKELRKDLKVKTDEVLEDIKDLEMDDVKSAIANKIKEIEDDIKNFDKEKAVDAAKKKAKAIEKKTGQLVDSAKKSARPKLVELTKEVKEKTNKTLDAAIKSLEKDTEK